MGVLMVGIGGFLGSCGRYFLTRLFERLGYEFPMGTLLSNVIAALLIGFIIGAQRQSPTLSENTRLFLTTGLLGGLSTFSTFSMETVRYFEGGKYFLASGNILLNVGLSLLCVGIGLLAAKAVIRAA